MSKYKPVTFEKRLTSYILRRFLISFAIYCAVILLILFLGITFFNSRIWWGDEFSYIFFKGVEKNLALILVVTFFVGVLGIFIFYWKKTLKYLQTILATTEDIFDNDNSFISLAPELKEVETHMNQIKLNVKENQRVAKEAEQRKNDLVVYLAHDLKTPLTSVIGYLTLLRDESQISQELREKYLAISLNKAERLEDLINEFFEITRFNLSNITLELGRLNLTRLLEQLIYEFKPMLSQKRLQCRLTAPPDITLLCDADKMQRVFDNLLRNAVNYSFEESCIDITVTPHENSLSINFANYGNTIPSEKLNRLFEQFYRLDTARATKSGGAGLGLAISKEIVELHHGTITAYSGDSLISFEVTLPAS